MSIEQITLRSSLSSALMRRMLWRGTFIAAIGAAGLIFGGAFLPPEKLSVWGLPLFIGASVIITFGLLPYRRLKKLEMQPYELIDNGVTLKLVKGNKILWEYPLNTIKKITYRDSPTKYGLDIRLTNGQNIFAPYFTERAKKNIVLENVTTAISSERN